MPSLGAALGISTLRSGVLAGDCRLFEIDLLAVGAADESVLLFGVEEVDVADEALVDVRFVRERIGGVGLGDLLTLGFPRSRARSGLVGDLGALGDAGVAVGLAVLAAGLRAEPGASPRADPDNS